VTVAATPPAGEAPGAPAPISVIFVSTGNAARGPMAEAILRRFGRGRFAVVSAGVTPRPVDPRTLEALARAGIDAGAVESRPVGAFVGQRFDYVITLCDRARLACPVFPYGRDTLHWGMDDPSEADGTNAQRAAAFDRALTEVTGRIHRFIPVATAGAR
jgi:arsenate reductase